MEQAIDLLLKTKNKKNAGESLVRSTRYSCPESPPQSQGLLFTLH